MQFLSNRQFVNLFAILTVIFFYCGMPRITAAEQNQTEVREHWRYQIKEGKTKEALQAAEKVRKFFITRFQPVSSQVYIEKSSDSEIFHAFTDYKDLASYKQILSKIISDKEWQAMYQGWISAYVEGTPQGTLLTSMQSFALATPVADLSEGQEGRIFFTSINLGSFREILAGEGQSKPVTISGTLKLPQNAAGKAPAVIILHGAGGVNDYYFEVADMLNEMGIAAFVVDSFGPRGITSGENILKKFFHSYSTRISDAYAALELLSTHPKIDKRRITVMGYSHGAAVALFVASEKIRWSFIADDLRFAASIAYYPGCITQFKNIDFTDAPVLMLLAEKDNICPAEWCLDYAQRIKDSGANAKAVVYKGAQHQFPVLTGSELIKVSSLPDWSNCKKEELLLLQDKGTWYSPHLNKVFDEVNILDGEYTANCRIEGGAIVAGNSGAKIESIKEYQNLLRRVFNLN